MGLIMVFGAIMPVFTGLWNLLIPVMIGAPDMALPRLNNWSFWLLPVAEHFSEVLFFMEGSSVSAGHSAAPLSTTYHHHQQTFHILRYIFGCMSSIMGSINVIVTLLNMLLLALK